MEKLVSQSQPPVDEIVSQTRIKMILPSTATFGYVHEVADEEVGSLAMVRERRAQLSIGNFIPKQAKLLLGGSIMSFTSLFSLVQLYVSLVH